MTRTQLVIAGAAVLALALGIALVTNRTSGDGRGHPTSAAPETPSAPPSGATRPATAQEPAHSGSDSNTRLSAANKPAPPQHKPPKPADYPTAQALPDRDGFVLSPYSNKIIDVRGIPSGTLVQDPGYPSEEKKYFRTP